MPIFTQTCCYSFFFHKPSLALAFLPDTHNFIALLDKLLQIVISTTWSEIHQSLMLSSLYFIESTFAEGINDICWSLSYNGQFSDLILCNTVSPSSYVTLVLTWPPGHLKLLIVFPRISCSLSLSFAGSSFFLDLLMLECPRPYS